MKEENKDNKKVIIPMIIGVVTLVLLVVGATYAYFTVGTSNNFGSKTISATTPEIGNVALTSGESLILNMTSELMMEENAGTYYATTTGTPSTTLTETNITTATVTGEGTFNCTYDLTITPTSTNSLYTAFANMTGRRTSQIVLTLGSSRYDFYKHDFSNPITIKEEFSNLVSGSPQVVKATLEFVNSDSIIQNDLQGKDITFTFTASNFSCTAVDVDPLIGKFVTLDNQSGTYYRVLYNETENTYLLLRMNNDLDMVAYNTASTKVAFENGNEYQQYAGSTLDTYMNETFYNTLSTNIKSAIVDKNIDQKAYSHHTVPTIKGDTTYTYQYEYGFGGKYSNANYISKVNVGTRHVYALDLEDIYKYMSAKKGIIQREITSEEINNMFFNTTGISALNSSATFLRSANNGNYAWNVNGLYGELSDVSLLNYGRDVHPAFLIDLSKIDFEEIDPSTITPAQLGNS